MNQMPSYWKVFYYFLNTIFHNTLQFVLDNNKSKETLKTLLAEVKLTKRHEDFTSILNAIENDSDVQEIIENEFKFINLYTAQLQYIKTYKSDIKMKTWGAINNHFTTEINNELSKVTSSDTSSPTSTTSSTNLSPPTVSLTSSFFGF